MMLNQQPPELFPERPVRSDFTVTGPSYRMRRITSVIVLIAVAGGGMYLAFAHSSHPVDPASVPTIRAETAYKERPDQPGGIEIPHQDVDVYKELGNDNGGQDAGERMMPVAEAPQPVPGAEGQPPVLEAPPVAASSTIESIFDTTPASEEPSSPVPAPAPIHANRAIVEAKAHEIPTTVTPPKAVAPVVMEKKVDDIEKEPVAAEVAKPVKKIEKSAEVVPVKEQVAKPAVVSNINKPVAEASGKSGPVVQLAASTNQVEAQKMLGGFEAKYASALDGVSLRLVRADLGSKGIYYRVQTEPVSAEQASHVCAALKKLNAGCFVVR